MNQTTTYNSAVEYHCLPRFERVGPFLRKCMEDKTWSGEEPRCEGKDIHLGNIFQYKNICLFPKNTLIPTCLSLFDSYHCRRD